MQRRKFYDKDHTVRMNYAVGDDDLWVSFVLWEDIYPDLYPAVTSLPVTLDGGVIRFIPMDLGTHSATDDGGTEMNSCPYLPNGCYYDGSTLAAENLFLRWQQSNFDEEFLYTELEIFHRDIRRSK